MHNKRVVVIGGASGIGKAVAEQARALGATVVVGSRRDGSVDVRDEASVERFFAGIGAFDHLVLTAGDWDFPLRSSLAELDLAKAKDMLAVRVWGALAAVKRAGTTIARDGSITLTSGLGAHRPRKGGTLAAMLGGSIEFLARGLAIELAPVRVNAVCPGLVLTEHIEKNYPAAMRDAVVGGQPIARAATPAEAAQAYLYAMQNGYVTGQILPVDGGALLV